MASIDRRPRDFEPAKRRRANLPVWVAFVLMVCAILYLYHTPTVLYYVTFGLTGAAPLDKNHIIMYSVSRCQACAAVRSDMRASGLTYTEYLIDTDPAREKELLERLRILGISPRSLSAPVVFVGGQYFSGQVSATTIRRAQQ